MTSPEIFRDVTILHGEDGVSWCQYLVRTFKRPQCDVSIHAVNIDTLVYENPPEIEASVRESYVLVLLVTADLLQYMEDNWEWLSVMLQKGDPEITSIVAATLNIDMPECLEVCETCKYQFSPWEFVEINTNGSNAYEVVTKTLEIVDSNSVKHKRILDTAPASKVCQMFPDKVRMNQDKIAIVFEDEIEGTVTLLFDDGSEPVTTMNLNSFCVSFDPPILTPGSHKVDVLLDGIKIESLTLMYCNVEFTSLELMRQFFGVATVDELDNVLTLQYQNSMCTDESLTKLLELAASQRELPSTSHYPTALHWAAAHGLHELTCQLLMSPCAVQICHTPNCLGETVPELALQGGHHDLKQYIDDFIEAKQCADACDTYVQAYNYPKSLTPDDTDIELKPSVEEEDETYVKFKPSVEAEADQDDLYETADEILQTVPANLPPPVPHRARFASEPKSKDAFEFSDEAKEVLNLELAPPLPHRSRTVSLPEITMNKGRQQQNTPTPEFLQQKTKPILKDGAVGCRSQNELIDIQDAVKDGTFTIGEAEMLFNAWKERYQRSNFASSFKDKQRSLNAYRERYKNTLSLLTKSSRAMLPPTAEEESSGDTLSISDPVLKRKDTVASSHRRIEERTSDASSRGSNNSVTMRSSNDSGFDMGHDFAMEESNQAPCQTRSSQFKSLAREFRQSISMTLEDSESEGRPPLPPRTTKKKTVRYSKR